MPRRPRELSPTGIYHVIMRGINRQSIVEDNEDRNKLIESLARFKEISGYKIFAYCLLDNHIHILIQEQKEPLSTSIKRISSSYVLWFNNKYERSGHLFQERFRSEVVDNDRYFLTVLRYIHQNPVQAKIVDNVAEYRWSSYKEYIADGYLVDKEYVLNMFANSPEKALAQLIQFHEKTTQDHCLDVEDTKKIGDEKVREFLKSQCGIDAFKLGHEDRVKQDSILRKLKEIEGISTRQIARITGISHIRVWRA